MKFHDVPQRGSQGNTVASRNRSGPYHRELVKPHHPGTAAQHGVWENMADLSWLWNHLSEEQWAAWRKLAPQVRTRPKMGSPCSLDGCQLFKKINRVLATCHREPLFDPPPLPDFGPNPIAAFKVRDTDRGYVFKLVISPKLPWDTRPPLEDIMLFSWAPFNPGADKNNNWTFIGVLPAPVEGESDITELYLTKLAQWRKLNNRRYHLPLQGSRIFVRAWQQVNGWENESGRVVTSALVPVAPLRGPGNQPTVLHQHPPEHPLQYRTTRGPLEHHWRPGRGCTRRSQWSGRARPAHGTLPGSA